VYGLFGIAEKEALEAIGADYKKSVLEVNTKTTMYLMMRRFSDPLSAGLATISRKLAELGCGFSATLAGEL